MSEVDLECAGWRCKQTNPLPPEDLRDKHFFALPANGAILTDWPDDVAIVVPDLLKRIREHSRACSVERSRGLHEKHKSAIVASPDNTSAMNLRRSSDFRISFQGIDAFSNSRGGSLPLSSVGSVTQLPPSTNGNDHSWHLYGLRLRLDKLRIDRDAFIDELYQRGIAASVHFIPIPLHSAFAQHSAEWQRACPGSSLSRVL